MTALRTTLSISPLLVVILIDSIGYTIVVPVLATALIDLPPQMMAQFSPGVRYLAYGVAIGIYELAMLYSAPVLGEISDRVGRRRILLLCMAGAAVSFLLIGAALIFDLILLLILARFVGGATAGSQPVAQAAAVDGRSEKDRTLTLSLCLFASSVGFILGPLIGGSLSHDEHLLLTDFTVPMFLMAGLAVAGLMMLVVGFRERPVARSPQATKINLLMGAQGFRAAWADPAIRHLVVVFGLMQTAWGTYFLFLPSLLLSRFAKEDAGSVSLLMALLGVGFCIAYGICLPLLEKRLTPRTLAAWGLWVTAAMVVISVASQSMAIQWVIALPTAIAVSVAYGAIIMLFSRSVSDDRQGWVLGLAVSVNALVWGLSSVLNGALSAVSYLAPFALCLISLIASAVLISARRSPHQADGATT